MRLLPPLKGALITIVHLNLASGKEKDLCALFPILSQSYFCSDVRVGWDYHTVDNHFTKPFLHDDKEEERNKIPPLILYQYMDTCKAWYYLLSVFKLSIPIQ